MENTENTQFNFEQASYTDLLAEAKRLNGLVADLKGEVTSLQNKALYTERAFANRDRQYATAKEILTSVIESEELDNEEAVKQLIEIFGIEILKTVEFTLSVEITGTVELPLGTELDEYSFSIDGLSYNGEFCDIDHDSVSIDAWNFVE